MNKKVIWIIGCVAVALSFLILNFKYSIFKSEPIETIKINNIVLNVDVADTPALREQGLSGRKGLGENQGLLFVFEQDGFHGFWMKDMLFPIDIAWIDKNKKIVHIEHSVSEKSYPKIFSPASLSLYVLETNANFFEKNKINIGDSVSF